MQHERTKDKSVSKKCNFIFSKISFSFRRFLDSYQYAIDLNNVLHNVLRSRAVSSMFFVL